MLASIVQSLGQAFTRLCSCTTATDSADSQLTAKLLSTAQQAIAQSNVSSSPSRSPSPPSSPLSANASKITVHLPLPPLEEPKKEEELSVSEILWARADDSKVRILFDPETHETYPTF